MKAQAMILVSSTSWNHLYAVFENERAMKVSVPLWTAPISLEIVWPIIWTMDSTVGKGQYWVFLFLLWNKRLEIYTLENSSMHSLKTRIITV